MFENRTQRQINDTKYHRLLKISIINDEYEYGKNDVFALIIVMKQMLLYEEFKNMMLEIKHSIDNLEMNVKSIPIGKVLDRMGFPENWEELIEMNKDEKKVFYEK